MPPALLPMLGACVRHNERPGSICASVAATAEAIAEVFARVAGSR
jgi:hypothetical protein